MIGITLISMGLDTCVDPVVPVREVGTIFNLEETGTVSSFNTLSSGLVHAEISILSLNSLIGLLSLVSPQSLPGVNVAFDQPPGEGCVVIPQLASALLAGSGLLDVREDNSQVLFGLKVLHQAFTPGVSLMMLLLLV